MNQILEKKEKKIKISHPTSLSKLKFTFWFSLFIIFLCLIFYFFSTYHAWQKEKTAKNLANQFHIRNLYANESNYSAEKSFIPIETSEPFVIGLLKIDKISLMYPILSNSSEELLKISPCRFYGPMPNQVGNLCIAGHNYANQKHFGKLSSLDSGDIFELYDLNGNKLEYKIYEKTEVTANDTSCLNQDTNGLKVVTLITCNTFKGTRIVLKAKENRL